MMIAPAVRHAVARICSETGRAVPDLSDDRITLAVWEAGKPAAPQTGDLAALIDDTVVQAGRELHELIHAAVTRMLRASRGMTARKSLFSEEELRRVAELIAAARGTAAMLGKALLRDQVRR